MADPSLTLAERTSPLLLRVLLLVGVVAVSFAAVLVRAADAPALALAFWRCAGGAAALLPLAWPHRGLVRRQQVGPLVVSGALLALHFALWIGSLSYTTVASSVVFAAMAPLFAGLGSALFLRRPPSGRTWLGIVVATVGAVVIGLADTAVTDTAPRPLLGNLMALGAAVAIAGYLLIGQTARERLPVTVYGSWVYGTAAVVLAVWALLAGDPLAGFDAATWWAILGLVVGPQLLGHTVFNQLLSALSATTVAVVILAEPVGAGVLAFVLLGEAPAPVMAVGGPLILAGVYLAASGNRPASDYASRAS